MPTIYKREMLGFQRVDFAKNVRVECYDSKYLPRRSLAMWRWRAAADRSHNHRGASLITPQVAKMNELVHCCCRKSYTGFYSYMALHVTFT